MKEATGDLNMTVIIVIAIAGLMAFFSIAVWPIIRTTLQNDADCSDAFCKPEWSCEGKTEGKVCCKMPKDESGKIFTCPYKG